MQMPIILVPGQIKDIRVRYGWFGRPIIQVRRERFRHRIIGPAPDGVAMDPWSPTSFRDATKHDLPEISNWLAGSSGGSR